MSNESVKQVTKGTAIEMLPPPAGKKSRSSELMNAVKENAPQLARKKSFIASVLSGGGTAIIGGVALGILSANPLALLLIILGGGATGLGFVLFEVALGIAVANKLHTPQRATTVSETSLTDEEATSQILLDADEEISEIENAIAIREAVKKIQEGEFSLDALELPLYDEGFNINALHEGRTLLDYAVEAYNNSAARASQPNICRALQLRGAKRAVNL